jgi:hypothetical protein
MGAIRIERTKNPPYRYTSRMVIASQNKNLFDLLISEFGGRLYKPTINKCYFWQNSGKNLDIILAKLIPFLIVKKSHVEVVMRFRQTISPLGVNKSIPNHIKQLREELYNEYRKLIFSEFPDKGMETTLPGR